jgi:hypothetical protein
MWLIIEPQPVVAISTLKEHCATTFSSIALPISSVFSPQLILSISHPQCPLPMPLILQPSALILVADLVVLNSKAVFLVVLPISNILITADPLRCLFRSILVEFLFLRWQQCLP